MALIYTCYCTVLYNETRHSRFLLIISVKNSCGVFYVASVLWRSNSTR